MKFSVTNGKDYAYRTVNGVAQTVNPTFRGCLETREEAERVLRSVMRRWWDQGFEIVEEPETNTEPPTTQPT